MTSVKKKKLLPEIRKKIRGDRFISEFLDAIGSPMASRVKTLFLSGQHSELVGLSIDPRDYVSADLFRRDYAAVKLLAKFKGLKLPIDRKRVAIESAMKAEALCQQTNQFVLGLRNGRVSGLFDSEWFRAKQIIAKILGPVPRGMRFDDYGWSAGRTSSCYGETLAGVYKYASRLDTTWSAQLHALRMVCASPAWGAASLNASGPCSVLSRALSYVRGNTLITVPKSAKTDRVICFEPHMNIRLQLSVGAYLKKRLLSNGVDLTDQSVNRRRARAASLNGSHATIDLSMASDTLAKEIVFELLPIDWALLLDDLRSKETLWPDGQWRVNEKFSSMGNGFTFELESLIFYALASSVTGDVSVFGDDIICPSDNAPRVVEVLRSAGFSVNVQKTFMDGPFRESCGMDAFCGVDVTPVYLKEFSTLEDLVKFHNAVRQWYARDFMPPRSAALMLAKWRQVCTIPVGPHGLGDGHFHVNFEEALPKRAPFWIDGWWFKTWIPVSRVSSLYGDRVSGRFSDWAGWSALCVSLGPKGSDRVIDTTVDRRQVVYKLHRALASFRWEGVAWD